MSETAALQAALAAALTARDVGTADVAVLQGPAARVRQRLAFYRGNVQANAHKALRNAFPVCERVVGEAFFEGMSHRFAAAVPSCSGDLNAYGAPFPAFVRGFAPAASLPYLPDVAALEWCVHRAHYAANRPPADLRVLAGVSAERYADLRVVLHPAVALLTTQSAAVRIWQAHQPGQGEVSDVDPAAGPDRALVYRPHFRVEVARSCPVCVPRGLRSGRVARRGDTSRVRARWRVRARDASGGMGARPRDCRDPLAVSVVRLRMRCNATARI